MSDDNFTAIDIYALEEECAGQAELAKEYNEKLADAQLALDEAEDNFELVKAEVAKDIRDDPDKYELSKITDNAVKEAVPLQPDYRKAAKRVRKAKHAVGIIRAATISIEHRKRMLEKAVDLWINGYYAEPHIKGEGREKLEERAKRAARKKGIKGR